MSVSVYQPLFLKYRPQNFAQLVGQKPIVDTLSNALRTGKLAHAYLFTGSRGTGKTSTARILAKSINCQTGVSPQPCGVCDLCKDITLGSALDVIEIDAASNTGVDNIRELIERAQLAPARAFYKVYIIDEVHMLSSAAFNALLKTLEEPPQRVIFILATTDPQRVLPTIISRCQRFDFKRIPLEAMTGHLRKIAELEQIEITAEALTLVAQIAQGGLRDAESLLDQLGLLDGMVQVTQVWDLVGSVPEQDLLRLLEAVLAADITAVLTLSRHLIDRGREPIQVLQDLVGFLRDVLLAQVSPEQQEWVTLTRPTWEKLVSLGPTLSQDQVLRMQNTLREAEPLIKHSTQPRLWLEVTLLELTRTPPSIAAPIVQVSPPIAPQPVVLVTPTPPPPEPIVASPSARPHLQVVAPPPVPVNGQLKAQWNDFINAVRPTAKAVLSQAFVLEESSERIIFGFDNDYFLKKVLFDPKSGLQRREAVITAVTGFLGRTLKVEFKYAETAINTPPTTPPLAVAVSTPVAKSLAPAPVAEPPLSAIDQELNNAARSVASFFNGTLITAPESVTLPPELAAEATDDADDF